jgi:senataxin
MRRPRDASDGNEDRGNPSGAAFDGGGEDEEEEWRQAPPPVKDGPGDALWRWRTQGLSELVLSWSVDQILDKDLLRDKVRNCLPVRARASPSPSIGRSVLGTWRA